MAWENSSGEIICSDCNWKIQGSTPRFSRRHYDAFTEVINHLVLNLENVHSTKVRLEAGVETISYMLDLMCDYFETDNINFKENLFRNKLNSPTLTK